MWIYLGFTKRKIEAIRRPAVTYKNTAVVDVEANR